MDIKKPHPTDPRSNVPMLAEYDPNNYLLDDRVPLTVLTDESLTPGRPPCLTQRTIGKFLQPLTRELTMVPARPTINELPDTVKDRMVLEDKAFWVDKPGTNAYTLHDAYYNYGMTTEVVKPVHQDVFPRSYQYDLECVKYRRHHGCDGLKPSKDGKKVPLKAYCRDCNNKNDRGLTPFQLAWAQDPGQRRWRYYPDLTATLTATEIRKSMDDAIPCSARKLMLDKGFRTCVSIQCPACDPLVICDDDAGTNRVTANDSPFMKSFNNGKSCLFSLKQSDISTAMSKFPIKVSVYKELPCGCLPSKIHLGEATIDMTKEFVQARKNFLEDPSNVSYEALKDSFHLMGSDGIEAGEILMFLRISCFGKWIVTRFQGGGAPPMIGSGMGGSESVDRSCNPPRAFQSRDDPCACGATGGVVGGGAGSSHGGADGGCEPARDPYNSKPCEDPDDPCYCSGPKADPKQQMACRNTQQYCLHVPKGRTKQFEEIGTNLCGNELKIKVPASASIIKKISQTHCAMQRPFVPDKGKDKSDPCNPPCGKNQISLALPSEDVCCHGAQLANTQFTCTTEGCPMASKHNVPAPVPPRTGTGDIMSNKDVFVLKVAKTAMQGDRKCKLEMELVTPKAADKVPPVQKRNVRMQSDLDCECCVRRIKKSKRIRQNASPPPVKE